jgi:hypothetical protein
MPQIPLRKARTDVELTSVLHDATTTLPPGDWYVEQRSDIVKVYGDAEGQAHAADVALVDFLDGLARREIVFVSWG